MATNTLKTVKVDLPGEIFGLAVNVPLVHQVVVAQQAAARQGTASTKTRGEVRGGGRKPYKQKGTGRARQGSTRAPQFAGGGTVHGPQPRSYDQRTPKKMKAAALRMALSDRAANDRLHVVEFALEAPSTKAALAGLATIADRQRFLVVLDRTESVAWLSLRNAPQVHIVAADQLNTYDVLASDDVVFSKIAYDAFVSGASGSAVATETPAVTEPVAKAAPKAEKAEKPAASQDVPAALAAVADAEVPGGALPLEDGSAPEGYEIKGNKDSMKFHAPGGRWYDSTVAEVWFKTAEDAEAAGFAEAGKRAKKADDTQEEGK
jgi:large subunit ribosomal protein L4